MYYRIKKRIIGQLSTTSIKNKAESKELATNHVPSHRVTLVKENRVHVYCEEESEKS